MVIENMPHDSTHIYSLQITQMKIIVIQFELYTIYIITLHDAVAIWCDLLDSVVRVRSIDSFAEGSFDSHWGNDMVVTMQFK